MFSVDDPSTWREASKLDAELEQICKTTPKPRYYRSGNNFGEIRREWEAIARTEADAILTAAAELVEEKQIQIPYSNGSETSLVSALMYKPKYPPAKGCPLLVLFHGGAFCFGSATMETVHCVNAVKEFGCVALSIEYSLSPDVKYPHVFYESWDVLKWIAWNASALGADPSLGFILGGNSAGALIACNNAHFAQDQGLAHAITGVLYSVGGFINPTYTPEKYQAWNNSRNELWSFTTYPPNEPTDILGAIEGDESSVLNNPLNWPTGHAGHPPAVFLACGLDMLRDESLIMERELRIQWGIKTKMFVYPGLPHIFWMNFPSHSKASQYEKDVIEGLRWLMAAGL